MAPDASPEQPELIKVHRVLGNSTTSILLIYVIFFIFFLTKKQFDKRQYYFNHVSNDKFAQLFSLQFMDQLFCPKHERPHCASCYLSSSINSLVYFFISFFLLSFVICVALHVAAMQCGINEAILFCSILSWLDFKSQATFTDSVTR